MDQEQEQTYRYFAVDWANKDEKWAVYDGNTFSKSLPKPAPDVVLLTENIPARYAEPFLNIGAKVLRCSPNATAELRKKVQEKNPTFEKNDKNDVKLIWLLYKKKPIKFRLMTKEPVLKSSYEIYKDCQEVRIRTNNRIYSGAEEALAPFFKLLNKSEDALLKAVDQELQKHLVYEKWLVKLKGIGPSMAGGLIALLDPSKFDTVSKMWAYSGYKVENGKVQRRTAGKANTWNNRVRSLMYNVVAQFIKNRTPVYREVYDQEKERQMAGGLPKGHAHNRAIRKTAKLFLQHYWMVSREIKGLPVSQPWVIAHGGHVDYVAPPCWP